MYFIRELIMKVFNCHPVSRTLWTHGSLRWTIQLSRLPRVQLESFMWNRSVSLSTTLQLTQDNLSPSTSKANYNHEKCTKGSVFFFQIIEFPEISCCKILFWAIISLARRKFICTVRNNLTVNLLLLLAVTSGKFRSRTKPVEMRISMCPVLMFIG